MKLETIGMKYGRKELSMAGIGDKYITFLCVAGSHRPKARGGYRVFSAG